MNVELEAVQVADVERAFFGDDCEWCAREEPCRCATHAERMAGSDKCRCTCGRCQWPYPLSDDGPLP